MEQTLIGALSVGAAGLIGKIVWDWLQKRKNEDVKTAHCADHECLAKELVQMRLDWMARNERTEAALTEIKTDLRYIKRKLDLNGDGK